MLSKDSLDQLVLFTGLLSAGDMASLFGQLGAFDVDCERAIVGWEEWCERLDQYFIANDIDQESENGKKRCKAIFLSSVGIKTYSLIRTLCHPDKPETKTLARLQELVKDHLSPEPIVIAERYSFYNRKQGADESAAEFLNSLRQRAESCDFGDFRDEALRDMFVIGLRDREVQKKLLGEKDLTLTKAFSSAQASERARKHVDDMCGEISKVTVRGQSHRPRLSDSKSKPQPKGTCFLCGELGHWRAQCPKKQNKNKYRKATTVKKVNEDGGSSQSEGSDAEYLKAIRSAKSSESHKVSRVPEIMVNVHLNGKAVPMELDTGATVSLISETEFNQLGVTLEKCSLALHTITGDKIKVYGMCKVQVDYLGQTYPDMCLYVVDNCGPALLGRDWLAVIPLDWGVIKAAVAAETDVSRRFPELFGDDLGCVSGVEADLVLKEGATPKFCKPRSVPFALKPEIEKEIQGLVEQGVLKKLDYSDWAAPIVPVRKASGGLRICGDYSVALNKSLRVPEHPMPNIEELLTKLNGGVFFTKLDLSQAYQQIQLSPQSQDLVAINTHVGLYTYTRVPYGISASPSIFQSVMDRALQGLECGCYLDDIVITGSTLEEHNRNVEAVLRRLADNGFRLQKKKCEFRKSSIHYLGFVVDKTGVKMDGSATTALKQAPVPTNKHELQSFLGLASQYRKFASNLSTVAAPLNALLEKDRRWDWTEECHSAFEDMKNILTQETVLAHYDPAAELTLDVDASPTGLGAVLSQKTSGTERPVAFASRSLTAAEKNYSQLDREALAIIYGVKRFHNYLYGRSFVLYSDNLPLCHILAPRKGLPGLAAARIQRWALELANYNFEVRHKSASKNKVADGLSRLPLPDTQQHPDVVKWAEEASRVGERVLSTLPVSAASIAKCTRTDPVLSRVLECVRTGWPEEVNEEMKPYFAKRLELSVEQDCLLWGTRVVVPPRYQDRIIELLHESHDGIVRMKSLARLHVWWPNLDREIEGVTGKCELCKMTQTAPPRLKHNAWAWPTKAWSRVHIDFLQIKDDHYLVMVDAYSKWPEVIYMRRNTTAEKTIEAMRTVFARLGICEEIVSDNGPPFGSADFKDFLRQNGIRHVLCAPYHPASNGEAERFVRTFKKAMKTAGGKTRNHACQQFLLSYRATPHSTTGTTPSEMMFGRRIRTRLDLVKPDLRGKVSKQAGGCLSPQGFVVGDVVLARDYRNANKPGWLEGVVVAVRSPVTYDVEVTVGKASVVWKRHVDQLKITTGKSSHTDPPIATEVSRPMVLPCSVFTGPTPENEYQAPDHDAQPEEPNGGRAPRPPSPEPPEELRVGRRTSRQRHRPSWHKDFEVSYHG